MPNVLRRWKASLPADKNVGAAYRPAFQPAGCETFSLVFIEAQFVL
jgi:hypothetical protein